MDDVTKGIKVYRAKPYNNRQKWAIEELAETLDTILEGFIEEELAVIRLALGNYTFEYLGLSYGLHGRMHNALRNLFEIISVRYPEEFTNSLKIAEEALSEVEGKV